MDPTAIRHAKARLIQAEAAAAGLMAAASFDGLESKWTDFLVAAASIFTKLEQGAKRFAPSELWFRQIRTLRRNDPLLRYLHHARNANEHGIQDTAHRKAVGAVIEFPNGKEAVLRVDSPDVIFEQQETGGAPIKRIIRYTDLVPIFDRGVKYDPPTEHLGEAIDTRDPAKISAMALEYLRRIVAEGEKLAASTN